MYQENIQTTEKKGSERFQKDEAQLLKQNAQNS